MHPAGHLVRAGVARADRLRRSRETAHRLLRAAPIAAALSVAVAGVGRWAGWPVFVPLGALALAGASLAGYVYSTRRDHAISDVAAAEIDAHAGLGGELRSAHWFSSRESDNPWVDLHLGRAAERLQAVDWTLLYPAARARGAKTATAVMAIAALGLALSRPAQTRLQGVASVSGGKSGANAPAPAKGLPPDLQKALEDLLRVVEAGTSPGSGTPLTATELQSLLSRIAQLKAMQAQLDGQPPGARGKEIPEDLKSLIERLERASKMAALSPEERNAFAEAADKVADVAEAQSTTPKDPRDAAGSTDAQSGAAAQSKGRGANEEMSMQAAKDASAASAGVVVMSSQDAAGGKDAGLGLGGGPTPMTGAGRMADIGAALRREILEAKTDNPGDRVETEQRRNTERSDATVAYTSTAPRAFERGRSTAPPAVPEGRRAGVHSYFIRKQ